MSNLVILPIIIPLLTGIFLIFIHKKLQAVRLITKIMALINLGVAAYCGFSVFQGSNLVLEVGGWEAPFGIALVGDTLSVILVISTNLIAVACAFYAPYTLDEDRERFYFYSLFQILIAAVSGAFLTGDIFNLFVFFEVLLMASYGLVVLGGTKKQLREAVTYLIINLFSSMLFVTTIAYLYSVTGTLNMADLAQRIQQMDNNGILSTVSVLLLFVFATKGAVFPLYIWLPKSYEAPPAVISALFGALLTKVGIYSILRVFTLIFNNEAAWIGPIMIWLAGLTMIFGVIGALSTHNVKLVVAYNIIPAIGFLLMGIGTFTETSMAGTLYYLINDMMIKAALFLLVGAIIRLTGTSDLRKMGGLIAIEPWLGWLFLLASYILVGLPPFGGFIGKFLLIKGALSDGHYWIAAIALLTSFLILLSMFRVFITVFWGETKPNTIQTKMTGQMQKFVPAMVLLSVCVFIGIGAGFVYPLVHEAAGSLFNPAQYIESVLKG